MFHNCFDSFCFKNAFLDENNYDKIIQKLNNDPSDTNYMNNKIESIHSLVKRNRQNEFFTFLVILADKHYKTSYMNLCKSIYDKLSACEFPGKVNIIHQNDLSSNQFIIKDNIVLKKLYIKSYKENLYIDAFQYDDYLLNSITNEFLHVISVLKPMSIKIKIYNQNKNDIDFNMNTAISFSGLDIHNGVKNQITTDTCNKKEWLLTFTKKNNHVDLSCFLDKNKFYYLPKKTEWLELIQNRVHYNVNTANYVYEHNSDNIFDVEFLQNIKFLKFDLTYKHSNYSNLKFEYEIIYFPL